MRKLWLVNYIVDLHNEDDLDDDVGFCRVMSLGGTCELREYPDMSHGWTTRGDIRFNIFA